MSAEAIQTMKAIESPSMRLKRDLEESLLSRILNAVEMFMKEEDKIPEEEVDTSNEKFRDLINFFLSLKKDFDILSSNYATLLHFVVKHGDNESFMSLLNSKEDLDVNAFNSKGTTLMHIVAMNGTCEMMQALLDLGANINIRTAAASSQESTEENNNFCRNDGYTPIHCAAFAGNLKILEMLLLKGADINAMSYYGTPLHFACGDINGNMEYDYLLKSKSFSLNDSIREEDRTRMVKFLLDNGAASELRDSNLKTALQRACFNSNYKLINILMNHVAPI